MKLHGLLRLTAVCLFMIVAGQSCVSTKRLKILKTLEHDSTSQLANAFTERRVMTGDLINITVFCLDDATRSLLNSLAGTASNANSGGVPAYQVDDSGYIKFPLLGPFKCLNMTGKELEDTLTRILVSYKYVLDPIITVRFVNFKVTVLGEVAQPGVINTMDENINVLDAIAMRGDLTVHAHRDNVLLIRNIDGKKKFTRFSLNDPKLFSRDHYLLRNDDILYIEPSRSKAATLDRSNQFITLGVTTLNFLILFYSQFFLNN